MFYKLLDYGEKHIHDPFVMDYFAVSMPDMSVFDADMEAKNKAHCYYLMGLGNLGLKKPEEAAEAVKKDSADENDTDSESDDSEDKTGKRYGNRDVQIMSVDMINSKGEVTDVLQADEAFCLDYHYKVNRPTDEINVGMGIFTIEGDWIFGTNTMFSEIQVKCNRTEGRLKMECEPLRLFTGEYVLVKMGGLHRDRVVISKKPMLAGGMLSKYADKSKWSEEEHALKKGLVERYENNM